MKEVCEKCNGTKRKLVETPHGEKETTCDCVYLEEKKVKKQELSAYQMADKLGLVCF